MAPRAKPKRRSRTAFVLSGGGNLGAIQVGMLRALAERDITPDVVIGCSVGALNGAGYAADPTLSGIRHLESVWRRIEAPDLMPSSRIPSALQLVRKGASLHPSEGLRRSVADFLGDHRRFDDLALPFQCVATDVDAAIERWFTEGELMDPILASAALPAVYPPVVIEGRRYLDGGVVDNVPLSRAVELDARTVYVLHVGLHGKPSQEIRRPIDAALAAYWIARNTRFARDLAQLPRNVNAIVLPPGDRPELRYDDFSQTNELLDQGYRGAADALDAIDSAEAAEPSRAERIRRDLFATADWRRVLERRRSGSSTHDAAEDASLHLESAEDEAALDAMASDLG